jgi:benzylsuccinate CoA-transferase BbsF subunit
MVAVACLNNRALTGEGQYVDFSMAEALSGCLPEAVLDYQMNDRVKEPMGNQDDWYAPHSVYHCSGSDRWVAIAVTNDSELAALCGMIGRPDLASNSKYATAEGRRKFQDEIGVTITEWTVQHEDVKAMHLLQQAGVPAGPSQDILRVFQEPQLSETGYFNRVQTRDGEERDLPGLPWRFEGAEAPTLTEAPVLGEHNNYVYQDLLGLSPTEVIQMVEEQIIY